MRNLEWNMDDALAARFEEGRNEGRDEGINVGINVGIESVALNMLRSGMAVDKIEELTQLSAERLQELARTLTK